jgi:hypothetical protein
MLFNPAILIEQPAHVLATAAVSATKTFFGTLMPG